MTKQKKRGWLIWVLLAAVVLLIGAAAIKNRNQPKGIKVTVENVEKRTIKEMVSASGKVFPEKEVKISSDVSGEIVELYVEEGDSVKAQQILAKIDPDAYQSAVERGEASVNNSKANMANSKAGVERNKALYTQAQAQLEQIQAQIKNTRAIHERNINLHKEGIISDADFEASLSNLQGLEANIKSMQASVKSAEANLESSKQSVKASEYTIKSAEASLKELKTNLRRTTLYAPNNGIVSKLNVEKGERVVGTIQMTGTELMRIANLNAMEVQVDVSETDVLRVSIGDEAEIEVDAYLDRKFKGVVTEIANSASNSASAALTSDQVTNFIVKIRVDPSSYSDLVSDKRPYPFRPGMSASVDINTNSLNDVLSVPIQAVTTREEEKDDEDKKSKKTEEEKILEVVFVSSGDTVKMLEVKTGIQDDNYIQILEGLTDGEEVITGPYTAISKKLKQGKEVRIVDEDDLYKIKKD